MIILIIGPPASGKGTQIEKIAEKFKLKHIPSPGDLFRKIGDEEVKKYLSTGRLVPDELVAKLVFKEIDDAENFILDSYPRNLNQAKTLDNFLAKRNKKLDYVIYLKTGEEEIIKRITNRRVCVKCGKIYNLATNPPKEDEKCECGGELIQREDDKEEVVRARLDVFRKYTEPLLEYYKDKLIVIDGEQPVDKVFEDICEKLKKN
ncbi:MAG TPA: nucleoside monophosphate kinase [Candidatus Aenigmarchaeota archaeon]|nr:MAG: adenylate kinase [Candidatus Aenigmarchaeota archaeon]HDI06476.1 nucleoside monophosphate kinase [Candidatus Aenigmarchaeota archaeon]